MKYIKDNSQKVKLYEYYAKNLHNNPSASGIDKIAGLFFAGHRSKDEDINKHNKMIEKFISNYANLYEKLLEERIDIKVFSDKLKKIDNIFDRYIVNKNVPNELYNNLNNVPFERKNINLVSQYKTIIIDNDSKFAVYKVHNAEKTNKADERFSINIYYISDKESLQFIDRKLEDVIEIFGGGIDEENTQKISSKFKKIYLAELLIKDIKDKFKNNIDQKKYYNCLTWFDDILKVINHINNNLNRYKLNSNLSKVFDIFSCYILSFVDFTNELYINEEDDEQNDMYFNRPIISGFRIGQKKLTYDEILDRYTEKDPKYKESIERMVKNEINVDFKKLLSALYPSDNKSKNTFLTELGTVLSIYLSRLKSNQNQNSKKVNCISFARRDCVFEVNKIKTLIPAKQIEILWLYESTKTENDNDIINEVKNRIEKSINCKNKEMLFKKVVSSSLSDIFKPNITKYDVNKLFPCFDILKQNEALGRGKIATNDLYIIKDLIHTASFNYALYRLKQQGKYILPLITLYSETSIAGETIFKDNYDFIDMKRMIFSMLNNMVQFVRFKSKNKNEIINKISSIFPPCNASISYKTFKNFLVSALKDFKLMEMEIGANNSLVKPNTNAEIYFVVEHSGTQLDKNGNRSAFYEIFKINVNIDRQKRTIQISRYENPETRYMGHYIVADNVFMTHEINEFIEQIYQKIKQNDEWIENGQSNNDIYCFFLTVDKNNQIEQIINRNIGKDNVNIHIIQYKYLKTPLLYKQIEKILNNVSSSVIHDTGMVIEGNEIKKGFRQIGVNDILREKNYYAITPLLPKSLITNKKQDFNEIINLEVSLFFFDREIESEETKNLIKLSTLLWLKFKTETFDFIYSKPKFFKKKLPELILDTFTTIDDKNKKNVIYRFDSFSLCVELAYLCNKMFYRI